MKKICCVLALAVLLAGCGARQEPEPSAYVMEHFPAMASAQGAGLQKELPVFEEPPAPPTFLILEPEAPGILEERSDSAVIDYSNFQDGYVMAQFLEATELRLKFRVIGPTTTYTYDLSPGQWTVFPLSDGNGAYKLCIYRQTSGSRYSLAMSVEFEAQLADEFAPFLRPNQYVNYSAAPNTMEQGAVLCQGITDPLEKVAAVYDYVVTSLTYDQEKADTVKSGYLPVLDEILAEKKGICFDYAALMTAMLRSQQVPCKLVVGYAGNIYHAWISVWTQENGWVDGAIFFDGESWKRMDPTFASYSQRSDEIMEFIENGSYTARYLY